MIEQKEYIITKNDVTFNSSLPYNSLSKIARDPHNSLHMNIFNDIRKIAQIKIKKLQEDDDMFYSLGNGKISFLYLSFSKYFYDFTWTYYTSLKSYYRYILNNNCRDTELYLKQDYMFFLLYLFIVIHDDSKMNFYMSKSLYSLPRFIEKLKSNLDQQTGFNRKEYIQTFLKDYLKYRKDFTKL